MIEALLLGVAAIAGCWFVAYGNYTRKRRRILQSQVEADRLLGVFQMMIGLIIVVAVFMIYASRIF